MVKPQWVFPQQLGAFRLDLHSPVHGVGGEDERPRIFFSRVSFLLSSRRVKSVDEESGGLAGAGLRLSGHVFSHQGKRGATSPEWGCSR